MIGLPSIFAALALMQTPAAQAPAGPEPREILTRALDVYAAARTYDALWTYTNVRGNETQEMQIEVKAKAPARLIFKVSAAKGAKKDGPRAVPEMLVVLDGKHAWFENTSEKTHFKVPLPREPKFTPLMFFPHIPATGDVRRGGDLQDGGKTYLVLEADRAEGGVTRMEIDAATHRVRRIVVDNVVAFIRQISTITVVRESFDADIPDKAFAYRPPRGSKEVAAPAGAGAMFGQ